MAQAAELNPMLIPSAQDHSSEAATPEAKRPGWRRSLCQNPMVAGWVESDWFKAWLELARHD
jgi:hypothetical protein